MIDTVSHRETNNELANLIGEAVDGGHGDPGDDIQRMLAAARSHLGMEIAFISEFEGSDRVIRQVDGTVPLLEAGRRDPAVETYCRKVVDGDLPEIIHDAQNSTEARKIRATRELGIGAHVSVPIHLADGSVYGTFCTFDRRPNASLNERDRALLRVLADLAGSLLEKDVDRRRRLKLQRERVEAVLRSDDMASVWQPIVEIASERIVGLEGLARFPNDDGRTPADWFMDAAAAGLSDRLESRAVENAVAILDALPRGMYVSCNLSAHAFDRKGVTDVLDRMPLERIVLELTEHDLVEDYEMLTREIEPLRKRGLRLAVDDAGAGYASFRHILRLRPEFIKMDMSLVRDIDRDVARRSLASAFERFGHDTGSIVIAEGVETERELRTIRELGIRKVQGYYLYRPGTRASVLQAIAAGSHESVDRL